jgi:hypothetical protein
MEVAMAVLQHSFFSSLHSYPANGIIEQSCNVKQFQVLPNSVVKENCGFLLYFSKENSPFALWFFKCVIFYAPFY